MLGKDNLIVCTFYNKTRLCVIKEVFSGKPCRTLHIKILWIYDEFTIRNKEQYTNIFEDRARLATKRDVNLFHRQMIKFIAIQITNAMNSSNLQWYLPSLIKNAKNARMVSELYYQSNLDH